MSDLFYMENRGSMTQFNSITAEQVSKLSAEEVTFSMLSDLLSEYGLSIEHVIHDPSRHIENTYYADYERGLYSTLYMTQKFFERNERAALQRLSVMKRCGNENLKAKNWNDFYIWDVPVPMLIFDFQKRLRHIQPKMVFSVWLSIYKRIDYSNGMWMPETLDYIFTNAPKTERPELGENGLVTIYRGMGELSRPAETAISWSTHPGNALWFANHSGRGTHLAIAEVAPDDIVAYLHTYYNENEVLVRPNTVRNIQYENMYPARQEEFTKLVLPALPEFIWFGRQAFQFGYKEESLFECHGLKHILRVLFLSLIYFYNSGTGLSARDKNILIYFSLLHDVGRTNEDIDDEHGAASVAMVKQKKLCIEGLQLSRKDCMIADLIIQYHCRDDGEGLCAINTHRGFSGKDKKRAGLLYYICKDADGLDRVRFNGLYYRMLRTEFARRLPIIAGCLLKENVLAIFGDPDTFHQV